MNSKLLKNVILTLITVSLLSCTAKSQKTLLPVKIGDKWGYINNKGQYVVNPVYDYAEVMNCGLALISSGGKYGYIDVKGNVVIEPKYISATSFSEDKAFVTLPGTDPLCINKKGDILFTLENCEGVMVYSEGLALFFDKDNKAGYVDEGGRIVIKPQFEKADSFKEGLALVLIENRCGYIDQKGNMIIQPEYEYAGSFSEGLAEAKINGKYGYINKKGEVEIPAQFDVCSEFKDGLACVLIGEAYGYIDKKGKIVINPKYYDANPFSNGYAVVCDIAGEDSGYGCIDKKGELKVKTIYNDITDYIGEYAFASDMDTELYGLIDRNGVFIVSPQFDDVNITEDLEYGIKSNHYDAEEYLKRFFEEYGDDASDGIDSNTTLKEIHAKRRFYEKDIEGIERINNMTYAEIEEERLNGTELFLICYEFDRKAFEMVDKYESFFGYRYKSGQRRSYDQDARINNMTYYFSMKDKALNKDAYLAKSLIEAISVKINADIVEKDNGYRIERTNDHPGYETTYGDEYLEFKVVFN